MTKGYTKNVLRTVWYQEICDKHYRKRKDRHKPWLRMSTSLTKLLHLFPALSALNPNNNNGSYNLTNNHKCKWGFVTTFINSCPLAGNYDQEEMDLSFAGCRYPAAVKLNRSWQLDLLDLKSVCIIEAIRLQPPYFRTHLLRFIFATL